jgi:hypothetical protein
MAVVSLKYKSKQGTLTAPGDVDPGAMIPIATTTLSTTASSITFSSIPQSYEHLQIRLFAQTNRGTYGGDNFYIKVGNTSVDSGSNYSWHMVYGEGTATGTDKGTSAGYINVLNGGCLGTTAGGSFGAVIVDILDYANTNKYKTTRALGGTDDNGASSGGFGRAVGLNSGLWQSASAIGIISLYPMNGTAFNQYTSAALYGIKRAGA